MPLPSTQPTSLAQWNDELRRNLYNPGKHRVQFTIGVVNAIGDTTKWLNFRRRKRILRAAYDFEFDANDQSDRDLGYFFADGHTFFFRIAAFDNALDQRSPDPANEDITTRVLTIMLESEY